MVTSTSSLQLSKKCHFFFEESLTKCRHKIAVIAPKKYKHTRDFFAPNSRMVIRCSETILHSPVSVLENDLTV